MRSRFVLKFLPLLCSAGLLLACTSPALHHDAPPAAVASADDLYLRGRNLHLERRYDEAIAAYEAALAADPAHVNAQNGLAIAYAERLEFAKAVAIWKNLTRGASMASGTGTAFLFANLGYAHFLQGNDREAVVALEKACLLDPLNARAWQSLGESLLRLGQQERAQQMMRQAAALRGHDLRADYAAANGGAQLPAIQQAVQAARRPDREWAFVDITTGPGGVLELRRVAPLPALAPRPMPETTAAAAGLVATLEIRNGNGRQGVARMVARQLRDPGLKVVKLSNEKGFGVRQTRIEYRPAFRKQAEHLADRLGAGMSVETAVQAVGHADLRLVIGRDLPTQRIAQRLVPTIVPAPGKAPALATLVSISQH